MKFKVDENLPIEIIEILQDANHDAVSVFDQNLQGTSDLNLAEICKRETRAIVSLDLDFADIRTYPPNEFSGIVVLRVVRQDKLHVISVFQQIIPLLLREELKGHLWIVEESQVRIRGGE